MGSGGQFLDESYGEDEDEDEYEEEEDENEQKEVKPMEDDFIQRLIEQQMSEKYEETVKEGEQQQTTVDT